MNKNITDYHGFCLHYLTRVIFPGGVKGNIIELGVGYNSLLMGALLKTYKIKKKVFACDCFRGLPYTDRESSNSFHSNLRKGQCFQGDAESFMTEIKDMDLEAYVVLVPGLIEDTLEAKLKDEMFCFAWCDVDLYKSTLVAYRFLENRITKGGVLAFHDYGSAACPGVTKVVNETLDRDRYKEINLERMAIFFRRQ